MLLSSPFGGGEARFLQGQDVPSSKGQVYHIQGGVQPYRPPLVGDLLPTVKVKPAAPGREVGFHFSYTLTENSNQSLTHVQEIMYE